MLVAAAACGSGSTKQRTSLPEDDGLTTEERERQRAEAEARQRADERRAALRRERPEAPFVDRQVRGLRFAERCGQGPYRVEAESLSARYGETFEVYLCAPHRLSGSYRFEQKRALTLIQPIESAFGWGDRDNRACVAGTEERAVSAGARPSDDNDGALGKRGARTGKAASAAAKDKTSDFRTLEAAAVPEDCRIKTSLVHHTWTTSRGIAQEKTRFSLELWSDAPNLLEGVVLVVKQRAVAEDLTAEAWAAYQAAERAWYAKWKAFDEEELRAGRVLRYETAAVMPKPPAPRAETLPPRPSPGATWIPGYWHLEDGDYHWLAGLWRVPPEDIRAQRTVRAPRRPPPPQDEAVATRAAPPSRRAVWTPGYWQWDGRAYVWIDGAWRIPPEAGQVWVPTVWEAITGGVILRPGGWSITIRR